MNTPVSKLRQRLFLLLAATLACGALSACHDDDHNRHTYRGHDRHDGDYRHDDHRRDGDRHDGYRRDAYYGGSAGGTSVTVRRETPVVRERSVSYDRY